MTEIDLVRLLRQTKDETLPLFHLGDADLQKTYAPGKWTIRHILHHLSDAETVLFERIRRTISEPEPLIQGFDQDAWSIRLNYGQRPLSLSRSLYESARDGMIYYARLHYKQDGDLEFIHSESGRRTLKQEFDKTAEHNLSHLRQIRTALGTSHNS